MADFTEAQKAVVMNRLEKLRNYLDDKQIEVLKNVSLTAQDLATPVIHELVGDIMALTGGKNLTFLGRQERVRNIESFIEKYQKV